MTKTTQTKLPEETLASLERLGEVLRGILARLINEGKAKIVDGKIIWNENVINRTNKKNTR